MSATCIRDAIRRHWWFVRIVVDRDRTAGVSAPAGVSGRPSSVDVDPPEIEVDTADPRSVHLDGTVDDPVWHPRPSHRYRGWRLVLKRIVDLVLGCVLLALLAPFLVLVLGVVRLGSPGPGLFRQTRVGQDGRLFRIIKFRSMHVGAEDRLMADATLRARYIEFGYKLPLDQDPRITRIGSVLRKTSIDELPQLVNVVRGEMSLVGPRPVLAEELDQYAGYRYAYLVAKPGLTGPWQVAGRDAVSFPHRARFDADYIDEWSLAKDLKILLKTIPSALRARGVS